MFFRVPVKRRTEYATASKYCNNSTGEGHWEMFAVCTERTRSASGPLWRLALVMTLAGSISVAAQSRNPSDAVPGSRPSVLPKTCLAQSNSSEKIGELLESIRDHPTAGAYNTLGVLYAQEDRVPCAITAFESSLRLQNQSWEAHYNLAVALLRKGDRARAGRELQTAVGQKPDSVSSRFALGTVLEDERKLGEAEEQFRSTVELDPHFTPGALKLSRVFIKEGKPGAAVAALEEALKQKRPIDEVESLQAALGVSYAENGEIEKGQAMLKELVAAHPNSVEEHFQLGLLLSRTGQLTDQEAAITQFREALSLDQSLDAARLSLGQALISLQKYSEAVPVLLVYTSHQPQDAQGFYALGLAHQELNNPRAAIQDLRRSVGLDGGDAASRLALGKLLASNGYTAAAIRHLEAAERLNPSDAEVHGELVSLLEKAGEKERGRAERDRVAVLKSNSDRDREIAKLNEQANQSLRSDNAKAAAENYRKAIELNPRDAKLHYNLSLALDRLPDIAAERMELQRAVELDPKLAVAQNQLGLIALRRGQHTEAEARFKKALEAAPAFAEAQSNLGVLYSQLGKNEEAAALFQQALKNDPDYSKARVNYGLLLAQQGTLSAAEQQFRTAIQINNDDADAYAALGMLLAKTDRGNDALQCFRKAVSLQPNSAQAHLNLGIALLDQFDRPGGFKEFSEAERLDPDLAAAHYNLGRFYFETGKYDDADRELATTVRLQPDYSSALYFLALTAKQENQPERSTELLRKVIALRPDNADAQYLLGQSLEHSGNDSAAIRHWKAAVQADPNHSQALYNLAKSLGRMHDPEAKQYQDRFDALQKNQQVADRVSELGNFALEAANAQNWPQALQQMNEAIELCGNCPQSAHLHKNLGLFYGRTGNIGEAKKELRTALRLAPNDADAQSALAALERTPQEQLK